MRASSSSSNCKYCTVSDARYKKDIVKEQRYLPVENTRSKETKMLSISINQGKTSVNKNVCRAELDELNLASDVYLSTGSVGAKNGQCTIVNDSMLQKKMKLLDAKTAVSDTLCAHKSSNSSVEGEKLNICHIMHSENRSSGLNHFPMFDINRKMKSILNPKKRSGHGAVADRLSEPQMLLNENKLAPHVIELAPEEKQLQAKEMTGKNQEIETCKSMKGFLHCQDDLTGLITHSAIDGSEFFGSYMRPSICTRGESDPSSSEHVIKEHSLNATLTSLEHLFCNCSNHTAFMISEMKGNEKMIDSNFKSSWSRVNNGSMQIPRDSCPGDFPFPLLAREHNAAQYLLITKKTAMDMSHGKQMIEKSKKITKVKGSASFEKLSFLTVPRYNGKQCEDLQPLENSCNSGDRGYGIGTDTHFLGTQNAPPPKTDTMHISFLQAPSSPSGETSSRVREGAVRPHLSKSESTPASPIKQAVSKESETELPCMNVEHFSSSDRATFISNREMSTSGRESMDVTHILSHVEKPNNSNSSTLLEIPICEEASNRWIKRLRHNPSDPLALGTKRFKLGDGQSSREVSNLFSRVLNYSKPNSDSTKCLKELHRIDQTMMPPDNGVNSSGQSATEIHSWIQRWCHNSPQAGPVQAKLATPALCEQEKIKFLFDDKQFPSIAAMALMGRAIKNFQPCEFQRRGSSVVWRMVGF